MELKKKERKNKTVCLLQKEASLRQSKDALLLWSTTTAGLYIRSSLLGLVFLRLFGTQNMKHNTVVREWCLE